MSLFSLFGGKPKAFALDFSDMALQLLEISGTGHGASVLSYKRMEIPDGIFERGLIKDQAKAIEVIQKLVTSASPKPPNTRNVVAELPESLTFLHHFSIPVTTDKHDLSEAVQEQVAASMPFTIDEYAWDFQVLEKNTESYEILFAAARADIVATYEQTLTLAGLNLLALEPESLSIARALLPQSLAKKSLVLFLDFGGKTTDIIFSDAAGIRLSISRPEGGRFLTETIVKKLKINDKLAEQRKCTKGLKDKALMPAITSVLDPLIEDIKQAIAYEQRVMKLPIDNIVLAGGGSRLPGLPEYLHAALTIPVQLGMPSLSIKNIEPQELITISGLAERAHSLLTGINFIVPPS
jgi:type IV pilus assembly protein PilM